MFQVVSIGNQGYHQTRGSRSEKKKRRMLCRSLSSRSSSTPLQKLCIGIRREGKNRWERRVAITPEHVKSLVKDHGVKVIVQPSTKRIFADQQFADVSCPRTSSLSLSLALTPQLTNICSESFSLPTFKAGAVLQEDLSPSDVIVGVKEVDVRELLPNKTYLFFSHTHKGQSHNMPMLQDVLDKVRNRS